MTKQKVPFAILAAAAIGGFGCIPSFRRTPSAYQKRHNPDRPKTQQDLDKLAAAEEKRQRKQLKKEMK